MITLMDWNWLNEHYCNHDYFCFEHTEICVTKKRGTRYFKIPKNPDKKLITLFNMREIIFNEVANGNLTKFEDFFSEHFESKTSKEMEGTEKAVLFGIGDVGRTIYYSLPGVWQKILDEQCGTDFQKIAWFRQQKNDNSNQIQYFTISVINKNGVPSKKGLIFKNKNGIIKANDPIFDLIFHRIANKSIKETENFLIELGFEAFRESEFNDEHLSIVNFEIKRGAPLPFSSLQSKITAIEYIGIRLGLLTHSNNLSSFKFEVYGNKSSSQNSIPFYNKDGIIRGDNLLLELLFRDVANGNFFLLKQFLALSRFKVVPPSERNNLENTATLIIGAPNLNPLLSKITKDESIAWLASIFGKVSDLFENGLLDNTPTESLPITDDLINYFKLDQCESSMPEFFRLNEYDLNNDSHKNGRYLFINSSKYRFVESELIHLLFWFVADNDLEKLEQILIGLGIEHIEYDNYGAVRKTWNNGYDVFLGNPKLLPISSITKLRIRRETSPLTKCCYISELEALSYIRGLLPEHRELLSKVKSVPRQNKTS